MPEDLIGKKLGPYEIRMMLGKGGMSSVYMAYQPSMDRVVALKVLPPEFMHDSTFLARFQNEARMVAKLEHINILPVYDVGEDRGIPYIVMRYLSGGTVSDLLADHLPENETIARTLEQVASALDYAHARGIIHRDIKPSNVLLDSSGNAYLADFGIARMVAEGSGLTGSRVIGTPSYVSPEQVRKGQPITPSVDIYALGVLAYEMLAGEPPYRDDDPTKTLMAHVMEPVPSVRDLDPNVSSELDRVVQKALAKRPEDRYPTAMAFAQAFEAAVQGTGEATDPRSIPPAPAPAQSQRPLIPPAPGATNRPDAGALPGSPAPRTSEPQYYSPGASPQGPVMPPPGTPAEPLTQNPYAPQPQPSPAYGPDPRRGTPGRGYDPYDAPPRRRRGFPVWLIAPFVVIALFAGVVLVAFALTDADPGTLFAILTPVASNNTATPTVTITPGGPPITDAPTARPGILPAPSGGDRLAFASNNNGSFDIVIIDIDGSNRTRLTEADGPEFDPSWAPDGNQIVYAARQTQDDTADIWIMDADGANQARLTTTDEADEVDPDWSPDGQWIAFASNRDGDFDIYKVHPDGTGLVQITNEPQDEMTPRWSSDSALIAYYGGNYNQTTSTDLFFVASEGGVPNRVTGGDADPAGNEVADLWPDWAPASLTLAFTTGRGLSGGQRAIWTYHLPSATWTQVTDGAIHDDDAAWSPDGTRLAFDSDRDGDRVFDLFWVDIASGNVTRITDESGDNVAPVWQPR